MVLSTHCSMTSPKHEFRVPDLLITTYRQWTQCKCLLTIIIELKSSIGVDIIKDINNPELSKYWCFVNILWLWAKNSFKSSAMYTVMTKTRKIIIKNTTLNHITYKNYHHLRRNRNEKPWIRLYFLVKYKKIDM